MPETRAWQRSPIAGLDQSCKPQGQVRSAGLPQDGQRQANVDHVVIQTAEDDCECRLLPLRRQRREERLQKDGQLDRTSNETYGACLGLGKTKLDERLLLYPE